MYEYHFQAPESVSNLVLPPVSTESGRMSATMAAGIPMAECPGCGHNMLSNFEVLQTLCDDCMWVMRPIGPPPPDPQGVLASPLCVNGAACAHVSPFALMTIYLDYLA